MSDWDEVLRRRSGGIEPVGVELLNEYSFEYHDENLVGYSVYGAIRVPESLDSCQCLGQKHYQTKSLREVLDLHTAEERRHTSTKLQEYSVKKRPD